MPGRSRLSIRTLVGLLIGGIGAILIAQSATLLIVAAPGYLASERVAAMIVADQTLFQTMFYRRMSDAPLVAALSAELPVDEREASEIGENRRHANDIYPNAVRLLRDLDLPGAASVLETLRFATNAWAEVSTAADVALHLTKSARDAKSVQEVINRAHTNLEALNAAETFIDAAIVPIDPVADRLIQVRRLAWSMRDHLEAVLRASETASAEGKPLSPDKLGALMQERGHAESDWGYLTDIANRPDTPQALTNAITSAGQWYVSTDQVTQQPTSGQHTRQSEVLDALAVVASTATDALAERADEQTVTVTRGLVIDTMSLAIAITVTLGALLAARRRVSLPLAAITTAMQRLAEGDIEAQPDWIGHGDEVDVLTKSMQAFREVMLRADEQAASLAAQAGAEAERAAETEAIIAGMGRQLAEQLAPLAERLLQLAGGDLTCALTEKLPDEFDDLRQNFNEALEFLQTGVSRVLDHLDRIHRGAAGMADAAAALSRRTDAHGNTLAQAIAALDALAANLHTGRFDHARTRGTASEVGEQAASSAGLLGKTADALAAFGEAAGALENLVTQIDEFVFRANLAAVKAGLEGTRLGGEEVPRAAAEIRVLAQRAGAAASEIKAHMTAAQLQAAQGGRLLQEGRQLVGRIAAGVNEINTVIDTCAATAETQSLGLDAFRVLLSQVERVTEQNASIAQDSVSVARTLADQADELKAALWRFRLDDDTASDQAA
jgi:methyl-accepting chemotaxis protein